MSSKDDEVCVAFHAKESNEIQKKNELKEADGAKEEVAAERPEEEKTGLGQGRQAAARAGQAEA